MGRVGPDSSFEVEPCLLEIGEAGLYAGVRRAFAIEIISLGAGSAPFDANGNWIDHETVPAFGNCLEVARILWGITERLSKLIERCLQSLAADKATVPHGV